MSLICYVLFQRHLLTLTLSLHLGSPLLWHLVHCLLAIPLRHLVHCLLQLSLRWVLLLLVMVVATVRLIGASVMTLIAATTATSFVMATSSTPIVTSLGAS